MSDTWTNPNGGFFSDGSNWSRKSPPGGGPFVLGEKGGSPTPYTVEYDNSVSQGSATAVQIASNATLEFDAGSQFIVSESSVFAPVTNAGVIEVLGTTTGSGTGLELGHAHVTNSGLIELVGSADDDNSSIILNTGWLHNSGTVEQAGMGGLVDIVSMSITNTGFLLAAGEGGVGTASGTGYLGFGYDTINNADGTIGTTTSSTDVAVQLGTGVTITGGTLEGLVQIVAGGGGPAVLKNVTISNSANTDIDVEGGGVLQLEGTVVNRGLVLVDSDDATGANVWISGKVTLDGGGTVELSPNSPNSPGINFITAPTSGASLLNVDDTIEGAGAITSGVGFVLNNETGGTIESVGTPSLGTGGYGASLFIDTGEKVINAGLLETSTYGSLLVDDALQNTGTILAQYQNLTIGGAVTGAGADKINQTTLAFNSSVAATQTIEFEGTGALALGDASVFKGQIFDFGANDSIELANFDSATLKHLVYKPNLSGTGGTLTVNDGTHVAHLLFSGSYNVHSFLAGSGGSGVTITFV